MGIICVTLFDDLAALLLDGSTEAVMNQNVCLVFNNQWSQEVTSAVCVAVTLGPYAPCRAHRWLSAVLSSLKPVDFGYHLFFFASASSSWPGLLMSLLLYPSPSSSLTSPVAVHCWHSSQAVSPTHFFPLSPTLPLFVFLPPRSSSRWPALSPSVFSVFATRPEAALCLILVCWMSLFFLGLMTRLPRWGPVGLGGR